MMLRIRMPLVALVMGLSFMSVSCTDDDKSAEEAVQPSSAETPATPPEDSMGAAEAVAQPVYFGFDEYSLDGAGQERAQKVADYMKANPAAVIQIEGHCDERGSIEYNLALGERRAQSIKNYLTQLGVEANRLPTISYGEEKPVAEGHDEAAWTKNRRGEFVISRQ